ncbi:hypothetical protein V8E53_007972, partial [Lactarius tabidus]
MLSRDCDCVGESTDGIFALDHSSTHSHYYPSLSASPPHDGDTPDPVSWNSLCRARHAAVKTPSNFWTATLGHISNSSGSGDRRDVYRGNEMNDPFTGDTNAGHNATLANTTPAGVNPANPTDTADSAGTTDPVDAADADLLEMLTNDLTGTSLEQDRSTPPLSPTPQGSITPQA